MNDIDDSLPVLEQVDQIEDLFSLFYRKITKELPSEWAGKYRVLTSDVTAFPGKASLDRFPYWREPLDRLSPDDPTHLLSIMGGAQIGKSTNFIESGIGYIIKNHPGNVILTSADKELSRGQMSKKIDQMIASSGLSFLIRPNTMKKRNLKTGDTDTMKEFPGGSLTAQSIKAVDKIRQNSFRYGFFDDFEAAVRAEKQAGDIIDLVLMRFNSFKDKMKVCFISTPEIKQTSLIEPAFRMGDQRYYFMPCPLCGSYIRFEWYIKLEGEEKLHAGVVFEKDENNNLVESSVGYVCPECKGFFREKHKKEMLANGEWKPTGVPTRPDWLSYHVSGLYSPPGFFDWTHHARQWLKIFPGGGIVKEASLQVFNNLVLGLTYEERKKEVNALLISKNTRDYQVGVVPNGLSIQDGNGKIMLLTMACDLNGTEDDARLDWEILAHSISGSTYSIEHGSIGTFQRGLSTEEREMKCYYHGMQNSVWDELREIIKKGYKTDPAGEDMYIAIVGIDTGYFTQLAYQFIDIGITGYNIVGVKGDPEERNRRVSADTPFYKEARERNDLYWVQSNQIKDVLSEWMKLKYQKGFPQPAGFMNYPMPLNEKYDYRYFEQYEGEARKPVLNSNGVEIAFVWEKKTQQSKNHWWDCRVYNIALRDIFLKIISKGIGKPVNWTDFCELLR
jgi:phage terminase large subunit GpA-like protein